jgi:hypothetical protein
MVPPTGFGTKDAPKVEVLRLWYKTGEVDSVKPSSPT